MSDLDSLLGAAGSMDKEKSEPFGLGFSSPSTLNGTDWQRAYGLFVDAIGHRAFVISQGNEDVGAANLTLVQNLKHFLNIVADALIEYVADIRKRGSGLTNIGWIASVRRNILHDMPNVDTIAQFVNMYVSMDTEGLRRMSDQDIEGLYDCVSELEDWMYTKFY